VTLPEGVLASSTFVGSRHIHRQPVRSLTVNVLKLAERSRFVLSRRCLEQPKPFRYIDGSTLPIQQHCAQIRLRVGVPLLSGPSIPTTGLGGILLSRPVAGGVKGTKIALRFHATEFACPDEEAHRFVRCGRAILQS